jgi:hypothetical protein
LTAATEPSSSALASARAVAGAAAAAAAAAVVLVDWWTLPPDLEYSIIKISYIVPCLHAPADELARFFIRRKGSLCFLFFGEKEKRGPNFHH